MDYTREARGVVDALRSVREPDETVWFDRALIAVADLFPNSAIAFALNQHDVWPRDRRRQIRADKAPTVHNGVNLVDLIAKAEAAAAADGGQMVYEIHLAKAFGDSAQPLLALGIAPDALVARTAEREQMPPPVPVPKRPRLVGTARIQILDEALASQDPNQLLGRDERTGTVERKRSILNNQAAALADQELAAVALVNGSREIPVYLIFGQDDDFTVRGEVDHRGSPLDSPTVRACQRRFDERLQACHPPISVKWLDVTHENRRVWIACVLGRARGTAVRTTTGAYPYRSGEDTHYATPEQITAWLRETADSDLQSRPAAPDQQPPLEPTSSSDDARDQRKALALLHDAVESFYKSPPSIPTAIRGRKLVDWQPVFDPILAHFRPAIEAVVTVGITSPEPRLERLSRELRTIFRLPGPRDGLTWIVEAPRLVTRLIADRLLVDAYCTEQWGRMARIGQPYFESYAGRVPWVLAPEFRHPETLGQHADVAIQLSLNEIIEHSEYLHQTGVRESKVRSAYAAITVGLALGTMARQENSSAPTRFAAWAMLQGLWDEFENWEEEPTLVDAFATLGGEWPPKFRKALPDRVTAIVAAYNSVGYFTSIPETAWASINRIAQQASL